MLQTENNRLFISHAWEDNEDYNEVIKWLNSDGDSVWTYCSENNKNELSETAKSELCHSITHQIDHSNIVLIIGSMYKNHSGWINFEITEALRLGKPILAIKRWGEESLPRFVIEVTNYEVVPWGRDDLLEAVKNVLVDKREAC